MINQKGMSSIHKLTDPGQPDDEGDQQLAPDEASQGGDDLTRDEDDFLSVPGRRQLDGQALGSGQVDEDVEGQQRSQDHHRQQLGYAPDQVAPEGTEVADDLLNRFLVGRILNPCLDDLERRRRTNSTLKRSPVSSSQTSSVS